MACDRAKKGIIIPSTLKPIKKMYLDVGKWTFTPDVYDRWIHIVDDGMMRPLIVAMVWHKSDNRWSWGIVEYLSGGSDVAKGNTKTNRSAKAMAWKAVKLWMTQTIEKMEEKGYGLNES